MKRTGCGSIAILATLFLSIFLHAGEYNIADYGAVNDGKTEVKEYTLEVLEGHWPEFYLVGTLPAYGISANGTLLESSDIVYQH